MAATTQDRQLSLELDSARLTQALRHLLRFQLPDLVDKATRKVAFDVVAETQRAMNGTLGGLPKRIDTGRLRGGWRVAMENGKLQTRGLAPSVPENTDADGTARVEGAGTIDVQITVSNNVEYAPHVELGTESMEPGLHLTRALRVVAQRVPKDNQPDSLRREIAYAWERG